MLRTESSRADFRTASSTAGHYKGIKLDCGYRMDIVVEALIIVAIKAVQGLLAIHEAQLLSYLRMYNKRVGLL
jgi:GxxExxY protein